MVSHGGELVMVWGQEPPIYSIGYDPPSSVYDSGFSVLFDDAPDPDDEKVSEGISALCLHCLIEEHPEIGRGLDLAREFGAADLDDDGEWVGRRLEPLTV